jgi:hypothetical protein
MGRHSTAATRLASARFFSPCCALASRGEREDLTLKAAPMHRGATLAGEGTERWAVVELQQFCFGQGDGSGVPRAVRCVACSIQIDYVRLPLGYWA